MRHLSMSWLKRLLTRVLLGAALALTAQAQTPPPSTDQAPVVGQPAAGAQGAAAAPVAPPGAASAADAAADASNAAPQDGEVPTGVSPGRFIPREQLSQDLGASFPVDI